MARTTPPHQRGSDRRGVGQGGQHHCPDRTSRLAHHRVERDDRAAIVDGHLVMEKGHMQGVRGAADRITGEVGGHESDRPRAQPHENDRQALENPSERGGRGDPDPPAHRGDQRRPGREGEPSGRGGRTHESSGPVGAVDHFGEANRHETLEGHHAKTPEQFDCDNRQQDPVAPDQPDAVFDRLRDAPGRGAESEPLMAGPVLGHQHRDCDGAHDGQAHCNEHRQREGVYRWKGIEGNEPAGSERPQRDRRAEHRAPGGEAALQVGAGVGGQRGVDVPSLERSAVE